jgi:hypothetical protein
MDSFDNNNSMNNNTEYGQTTGRTDGTYDQTGPTGFGNNQAGSSPAQSVP